MAITMRSGLVVDLQNPTYIPCNPDNIVTLSNGEQGLVEYTCPYKAPKDSLTAKQQAALRLSDFCSILNSKGQLQLKRTVRTYISTKYSSLKGNRGVSSCCGHFKEQR